MKTTLAILMVLVLGAVSAPAQFSRVKEKARNLDDKMTERHNSAENGAPPPGPAPKNSPAQPGKPAAPATPQPVLAPIKPSTQQQAATKLKADIAAARTKGEVTAEAKKEFAQDLKLAVLGSSQPSPAALATFSERFLPAVAARNVTAASDAKLVQNIVISLNCAGLSASRMSEITGEVQGALTKAGAAEGDATKVAESLTAIIAEVQSGGRK